MTVVRFPLWTRYALATGGVGFATVCRYALDPILRDQYPFVTYFILVALLAWRGETGVALTAALLSSVATWYLFVPPRDSFALDSAGALGMVLFATLSGMLVVMGHSSRQERRRSDRLLAESACRQAELESAVRQREAADSVARERLVQLDRALATAGMLAWRRDLATGRMTLSSTAKALLGLTAATPLATIEEAFALVHPEDAARHREVVAAAARDGTGYVAEFRIVRPDDGTIVWLEDRATVRVDAHGRPVAMSGITLDITRRKADEERLKRSEEQFRLIADTMPQIVWMARPDGYHEYYNRRWYDYVGCTPAECAGHGWSAPLHPEDADRARATWARSLETGEPYQIEYRFRGTDGAYRWFLGRALPVRNAAGAIEHWYGTCTDIDDFRRVSDDLRDAQARLEATLEAGSIGTGSWDIPADRVTGDRNLARLFGMGVDEFNGRGMRHALGRVHPEDAARAVAELEALSAADERYESGYRVVDPDGTTRWLEARGRLERDESGRVVRLVGVAMDVTPRKLAEAERDRLDAEVAAERARLEAVLRQIPMGVIVARPDGSVALSNPQADALLGRPGATLGGVADYDVFRATRPDGTPYGAEQYPMARALLAGESVVGEEMVLPRGGRPVRLTVSAAPVRGPGGEVVAGVVVFADVTERAAEQDAVRRSERLHRTVLDAVPAIGLLSDEAGGVAYVNRRWYEYTGMAESDTLGRGFASAVHPDDRHGVLPAWLARLAGGEAAEAELRLLGRDGRDRWFLARAEPLPGADAPPTRFVGTMVDVDDFKQTEASLRREREELSRSRQLFQRITEATPDVLFMFDVAERRTLFVNAQLRAVLGHAPASLVALGSGSMGALVHPDDAAGMRAGEAWFDRSRDGEVLEREYRMRHADGTYRLVRSREVVFERTPEGRARVILGSAHDVTERRRAERENERLLAGERRRAARLRELAAAARGVSAADSVEAVARAAADAARVLAECGRAEATVVAVEEGRPQLRVVSADGCGDAPRGGDLTLIAAPLTGRDGRDLGTLRLTEKCDGDFTQDDESVLAQLAAIASVAVENARLVEALRDADRRKNEFLATLAHELRNPLAPIRNSLRVLRLAGDDAEGRAESLRVMDRQMAQMVRLIDDLLDVSRIERGRLQLRKTRVELADVLRDAVESARPLVDEFRHTLTEDVPAGPVALEADPTRLSQVVSNLLTNAAKYTEPGGRIALSAAVDGAEVVVRVRDNGIGIPRTALPRLFEMFSQVEASLDRSQGGLGIGLALVRGLVEMHGGRVEARSDGPGRGSEFAVRLPLAAPDLPAPSPPEDRPVTQPAAKRRILVVDDKADSATSLGTYLRLLGNETRTAGDGLQALAVAEEFRPDIVLMDIGMPKLNGYEAARRIRAADWGRAVYLIALTGWGQEEDKRLAREAGFDRHLTKPVDPEEIEALLAKWPG